MVDIISIDYEMMQQIVAEFVDEHDRIGQVISKLYAQLEILENGEWVADAATRFYQDMNDDVMIGMRRLHFALHKSDMTTRQIIHIFLEAEELGASTLSRSMQQDSGNAVFKAGKKLFDFVAGGLISSKINDMVASRFIQYQMQKKGVTGALRSMINFRNSPLGKLLPNVTGGAVGYVIGGVTGEHNWTDNAGIASGVASSIKAGASTTLPGRIAVGALDVNQMLAAGAAAEFQIIQDKYGVDMRAYINGANTYGEYTSMDKAIEKQLDVYDDMTQLRDQMGGKEALIKQIDSMDNLSPVSKFLATTHVRWFG